MSETHDGIVEIDASQEHTLDIGNGLKLWYRTWGNCGGGIPVLFVHGGPGQCVADYGSINAKFFEASRFYVVEVDQRGTGRSTPSVRDDWRHMQHYIDISIKQMSADFELVRTALNIEKWLVFGGSWGSALGLDYATRYPDKCLGLILRGIFLNTTAEFDAIYCRNSFKDNPRLLSEFDTFFELAVAEAEQKGEPKPDPDNESERFVRLYESMVLRGDRDAIWRFYTFENNLIIEGPEDWLDPLKVPPLGDDKFLEAQSVAFFECRLFLRGTFEEPIDLLSQVKQLAPESTSGVPTWVVQGTGDEVCPSRFAEDLVHVLNDCRVPHTAKFVDGGHKASGDAIGDALRACVQEFELGLKL